MLQADRGTRKITPSKITVGRSQDLVQAVVKELCTEVHIPTSDTSDQRRTKNSIICICNLYLRYCTYVHEEDGVLGGEVRPHRPVHNIKVRFSRSDLTVINTVNYGNMVAETPG